MPGAHSAEEDVAVNEIAVLASKKRIGYRERLKRLLVYVDIRFSATTLSRAYDTTLISSLTVNQYVQ